MYVALPFVGAAIGLVMYAVSVLMLDVFAVWAHFLQRCFIVLTGIMLTGGLHLDGWADTGDAFFSYRDREKRLEILDDPRLGAFGTMALVLLIVVKIALFHEILMRGSGHIVFIHRHSFLGESRYEYVISQRYDLAKDKGIAHFFKEKISTSIVVGWIVSEQCSSFIRGRIWIGTVYLSRPLLRLFS